MTFFYNYRELCDEQKFVKGESKINLGCITLMFFEGLIFQENCSR